MYRLITGTDGESLTTSKTTSSRINESLKFEFLKGLRRLGLSVAKVNTLYAIIYTCNPSCEGQHPLRISMGSTAHTHKG